MKSNQTFLLEEDTLKILRFFTLYEITHNNISLLKKICILASAGYLIIVTYGFYIEIAHNASKNLYVYIISSVSLCAATSLSLVDAILLESFYNFHDVMCKKFRSLSSEGDLVLCHIKEESKKVIICIVLYIGFVLFVSAYFFYFDKKYEYFAAHKVVNLNIFYRCNIILESLVDICEFAQLWGAVGGSIMNVYLAMHSRFQFKLLRSYVKKNLNGRKFLTNKEVKNYLQNVVILHLSIKSVASTFSELVGKYSVLIFFPAAVSLAAMAYLSLIVENVQMQLLMIFLLGLSLLLTIMGGVVGQLLLNESAALHDELYNCSWLKWSKANCMSLQIMLVNTAEPIRIRGFGKVYVDYTVIIKMLRVGYGLIMTLLQVM